MTMTRFLLAGLTAINMLTTPALAHEHAVAMRRIVLKANAVAAGGFLIYGRARGTAAEVRGIPASALDQPGGFCDHGDNAMIC